MFHMIYQIVDPPNSSILWGDIAFIDLCFWRPGNEAGGGSKMGHKTDVGCLGQEKERLASREKKKKRKKTKGGGKGRGQKGGGIFQRKEIEKSWREAAGKHSFSRTLLHHLPIYTYCFAVCLGVAWLLWVTCSVFFSLLVLLDTPCSSP